MTRRHKGERIRSLMVRLKSPDESGMSSRMWNPSRDTSSLTLTSRFALNVALESFTGGSGVWR